MGSVEARETRTCAVTLPVGVTAGKCNFRKTSDLYSFGNVTFCNIYIVLFLQYGFLSHPIVRRHCIPCLLRGNTPDYKAVDSPASSFVKLEQNNKKQEPTSASLVQQISRLSA